MNPLDELLGDSAAIEAVRSQVRRVIGSWSAGRRPPPVLIQGETGTGKGLLARALHRGSPRAAAPFLAVNCAAIPETLLEAELFGYERGAFTGAQQAKPGLFQLAHRGTLFLDELGLLPLALQAKLLSVLEDGAVRRLGSTRTERTDVWIIAATNEDLEGAVRERRIREDLYHRLAVLTLELPPLRARGEDVLVLAEHFLARASADYGLPAKSLTHDGRCALLAYGWPGNVRELANCIERAALMTTAAALSAADLGLPMPATRDARPVGSATVIGSSRDVMREHLLTILTDTGWNISRTAARLGVTRNTVAARIARFGLRPPPGGLRAGRPRRNDGGMSAVMADERGELARAVYAPLRWERRHLAFLVVRVVVTGTDREVAARRLLALAEEKIEAFGGRIETRSPAGLCVVFGVEPTDEPSVGAAHAALVIHRATRDIVAEAAESIGVKIALHNSDAAVGLGANGAVLDGDAARDAWNACERLLGAGERSEIVATKSAASVLRRRFTIVPLDAPAAGYRVDRFWRTEADTRASEIPFVGRREELSLLESRLAALLERRGHVVDVAGEAGVGKSRLLLELARRLPAASVSYLEGRCLAVAQTTPFFAVLPMVKAACGIADSDPPARVPARVAAAVASLGLPADVEPDLVRLLGAEVADPDATVPPELLAKRLYSAVQRLLIALSVQRPVLAVVEDLHWLDRSSQACLETLGKALGGAAVLLIVTYRTGYRSPWAGSANVTQLALQPLLPADSLALVRSVVQEAAVVQPILSRGEGNPLFLEELSRATLDAEHGLAVRVPASLEETIAARIDRLSAGPRAVLDVAAVIGRDVTLRLLRHVVDRPERGLTDAVDDLQRGDFLHEVWASGVEPGFAFKHALVHEVTYDRIPDLRRRELHRRILDGLERLYADRLTERVESLAHHAVEAEDHDRAVRYLLETGRKSASRSALVEAISHWRRALEILGALPRSKERDRRELELHTALGPALLAVKGYAEPEVERSYTRARVLCGEVGDLRQLFATLRGQWILSLLRARYPAARTLAAEMLRVVEGHDDPALRLSAHLAAGTTELFVGELVSARGHMEDLVVFGEPDRVRALSSLYASDVRVSTLGYRGRVLWLLGYPDQALAWNRDAVGLAETLRFPYSTAQVLGLLAHVHAMRGEVREALEWSERAVAYARDHALSYWAAVWAVLHGWAVARTGDRAQGIEEIRRAIAEHEPTGARLGATWYLSMLADVHGMNSEPDEGLALLDQALALVATTRESYCEAEVHRLRGELLLAQGKPEADARAEAEFRAALAVARRQHARAWELRAATSLARHWYGQGRGRDAVAVLAPIHASFTEGFETADLCAAQRVLDKAADG